MTIGQAAWMAVLAVLLSTRFVCLSNQQQEQKATPAQLASSETLTLCTALIVWSVDHPPEGEYFDENSASSIDLTVSKRLNTAAVEKMVVPTYLDKLPSRDPWGHLYDFLKNTDRKQPWTWAVRSPGPDGHFCSESYLRQKPDWDKCDDIVRVDGVLVAGPVPASEEQK